MNRESLGEIIIYETEDGESRIECRLVDKTIWMSQKLMAELFNRTVPTINEHLKSIFADEELREDSVIRNFRITAADGKNYDVAHYNLEAVLAVGFRVKSPRGTQFRRWANTQLRELITKGFVMDDERLKNPGDWDYFDELLERIREIRASEKRFYQKVRDLFSLSVDYKDNEKASVLFFAGGAEQTSVRRNPANSRGTDRQQGGCTEAEHGADSVERLPGSKTGCDYCQKLPVR